MKKEVIEVDKKKGVYRITLPDERWYTMTSLDKETGLPIYRFVPSVTWITSYVFKGIGYYKWLANLGWDESEAVKNEAGDRGSKIHSAIERLINGVTVKMEDKFYSKLTDQEEELNVEEYNALCSFKAWCDEAKPEFILKETTVISKAFEFAGTVDCLAKIDGQLYIIDWKSSQYVWPSMEAQLSAYKQALLEMGEKVAGAKLAVLQVGYKRNKRGWKFTEVEDQFKTLFLAARAFWKKENKDKGPKQMELPLSLKLKTAPEGPEKKKVQETLVKAVKTPVKAPQTPKKGTPVPKQPKKPNKTTK